MKLFCGGSARTLLFSFAICASAVAGTDVTPDAEFTRLQEEAAQARNELNAELLKPGAKPSDAKAKQKAASVAERDKTLSEAFRKRMTRPPTLLPPDPYIVDSDGRDDQSRETDANSEPGARPLNLTAPAPTRNESAANSEPQTVLSGEGIKQEIIYPKKGAKKPTGAEAFSPSSDPSASPTPATLGDGVSEIQYGKPKRGKPNPKADTE